MCELASGAETTKATTNKKTQHTWRSFQATHAGVGGVCVCVCVEESTQRATTMVYVGGKINHGNYCPRKNRGHLFQTKSRNCNLQGVKDSNRNKYNNNNNNNKRVKGKGEGPLNHSRNSSRATMPTNPSYPSHARPTRPSLCLPCGRDTLHICVLAPLKIPCFLFCKVPTVTKDGWRHKVQR